jgi:hypothetical protein
MDQTDQRYAYRCLPLSIANAHGWEILCGSGLTASWDGGRTLDSIKLMPDGGGEGMALSHFGHGILTFNVPCVFQTEPGYDLMAMGPINRPKDGIAALSAVIETDWSPYSFTMNWLFTRPQSVRFEKGEPFCHIMPVRRGEIEAFEPALNIMSASVELSRQHEIWVRSRREFLGELQQPDSTARAEKWQKRYHQGIDAEGAPAPIADHRTRIKLRPFKQ